jgi:phosphate transport system permease protein
MYFRVVCLFSVLALTPFCIIVWKLFSEGVKQFQTNLFTQISPTFVDVMLSQIGDETISGGILNGICGSFLILVIAIIPATPIGILTAVYISDNFPRKFATAVHYANSIMLGAPSIVVGTIVYLWIVKPQNGFSALAGGISLAIIMIPVVVHYTLRVLKTIPAGLKENGFALGMSYIDVMLKIVLPAAGNGLLAGVLLAASRVLGKTAPLIVTALGASTINWDINKPTASISLLIWNFFKNPHTVNLMWSAALFLFAVVMALHGIAKCLSRRQRNTRARLMNY